MSLGVGIELLKAASLEPLVVENQAVMIPEEDLDPIATAVEKQEEMASQGVLAKVFSNQLAPNIVQSMEVITGAPPAEYGDKTSALTETRSFFFDLVISSC